MLLVREGGDKRKKQLGKVYDASSKVANRYSDGRIVADGVEFMLASYLNLIFAINNATPTMTIPRTAYRNIGLQYL